MEKVEHTQSYLSIRESMKQEGYDDLPTLCSLAQQLNEAARLYHRVKYRTADYFVNELKNGNLTPDEIEFFRKRLEKLEVCDFALVEASHIINAAD